jgi:pSer/pThr/pTyr-binding forkhead associated (FHA) protein
MSFRLVPLSKGTAPVIAVQRPVLLIGRHGECDVRIESSKISRRHCCIAMAYDRILVRDLGSRNGVRINGRLIEEDRIETGDELAIGPILYRLESEEEVQDRGRSNVKPVPAVAPPQPAPAPAKPSGGFHSTSSGSDGDSRIDLVPLED